MRTDPATVKSHYGGAVLSGGRLDAAATVAALRHLGANHYTYLVRTAQEWADLPAMLRATEGTDITVWAYLVSPSSAPRPAGVTATCWSKTYVNGGDYVSIFRSLGRLSKQYPHLTAISIDDFAQNAVENPKAKCQAFSVARVARMRAAARSYQPAIKFMPVLYNRDFRGATIPLLKYRPYLDGAIFPYRAEHELSPGKWAVDYEDISLLRRQVKNADVLMNGSRRLYVMTYAIHRCEPDEPRQFRSGACYTDTAVLSQLVRLSLAEAAAGRADGIVIYRHPLDDLDDPRLRVIRAVYNR